MKKAFLFLALFLAILLGLFLTHDVSAPQTIVTPKEKPTGSGTEPQVNSLFSYKNSTNDLIVVDLPYPNAVTGKTFTVMGKARGSWYFEASFPVTILDDKGVVLARGIAKAKSDWMTTNFVPFEAVISIPETYTGKATLVLHKDNPSGLPEKDATLSFPFTIEY